MSRSARLTLYTWAGALCLYAGAWSLTDDPRPDNWWTAITLTAAYGLARTGRRRTGGPSGQLTVSVMAFVTPIGYCLVPVPALVAANVVAILLVDGLLRRTWADAVSAAARGGLVLSAAGLPVAASGLPSSTPGTWQVGALLVAGVLIGCVTDSPAARRPGPYARGWSCLAEAGCAVAFAVLILQAAHTGRVLWGLLALLALFAYYLETDDALAKDGALGIAQQLLELPHVMAARMTTATDLTAFAEDLRRIVRADRLWLHTRLPAGEAWLLATSADGCTVHDQPPPGHRIFADLGRSGRPGLIPRWVRPAGWRAGVHTPLRAPDGQDVGYLLLGWTRRSGSYNASRMTSGVLGGALTSTARALGALWATMRSAHALEQERSRLSAVIDHSDVAILAIDTAGRIAVWNMAMSHLTGITAQDALGAHDDDLFLLYDEDESRVRLAASPRGSVRLVTHAGRSLWVQVSTSAPADPSARELLTAVFVDESAQRQLESMRHLLLNSVHHELHGPLTAIRGHAQLLGDGLPAREATTGSLEAILDAVELMQHVVGDMVLIIDADPAASPAARAVPVDVASVLRRTLRGIPSVSARSELDAPGGIIVSGDPVRLRQCVMLVLGNAEKYAPDGKITLTVRERDGRYGVLGITDEGPGIPADEQDLVLKPYYRSAAEHLPGSGMGLHIANVMMTAMHGRIELATAPSGGLTVSLWLPLATT